MRATLPCTACGTVLGIPKSGMPKAGLSCNWCGYVNVSVVEESPQPVALVAAPNPARNPEPPAPTQTPQPKAEPHRWADDEDDNGQPYVLPHEEAKTRPCTACKKDIELLAVVCVHCGYDAESKSKAQRTYQPIDREWQSGWPKDRRIACFLLFQAMNLGSLLIGLATGGSLVVSVGFIMFFVALQAFICGTYESVRIRRNKKGQAEITSVWRVGFIPMAPTKVNWREHEGVVFGHYDATGLMDWAIVLVFLPMGIIPAILWWYYVIRSDRFFSAFSRDHGFPATYLYRGTEEKKAKEITQIATDATALPLVTKI
jgi:hypothetical protein